MFIQFNKEQAMDNNRFWKKNYDAGIDDLDPALWEVTLIDSFKKTFQEFPDRIALVFMGVEITYGQLDIYAQRFAGYLRDNGFKKGDVIGINLPNIPEYIIGYLGILRAGCIVSGVSPLLSQEELVFQLQDSNARGLITLDAIYEKKLYPVAHKLPSLKFVCVTSIGSFMPAVKSFIGKLIGKIPKGKVESIDAISIKWFADIVKNKNYSAEPFDAGLTPDDIAYIQYTGGTTGVPKGAMISHRNALSDLIIVQTWLLIDRGGNNALSAFPLFHIAGLFTNSVFINSGLTQILIPNPRDTDHICSELKKYKPFFTANVPSLYHLLMGNPKFKKLDHSTLHVCVSAAASYPEESQKQLEEIIGQGKLLEAYGMTETSPLTTMNPTRGKKKLGTIGLPLMNTDIRLLDPSTGEEVPPGEPGEICIKGPQVMVGYYNKPEETAQVIDARGYLHTGDVAVQDSDGFLRIVDRTKDMINVSGFKVFSKKIEEILTEHPAIELIATIGIPDPEKPGSEMVKAFVKLFDGFDYGGDIDVLKEDIISFAREKLSPFEVPKVVEFRKELPLTSVGKLDKKQLRKEEQQVR